MSLQSPYGWHQRKRWNSISKVSSLYCSHSCCVFCISVWRRHSLIWSNYHEPSMMRTWSVTQAWRWSSGSLTSCLKRWDLRLYSSFVTSLIWDRTRIGQTWSSSVTHVIKSWLNNCRRRNGSIQSLQTYTLVSWSVPCQGIISTWTTAILCLESGTVDEESTLNWRKMDVSGSWCGSSSLKTF